MTVRRASTDDSSDPQTTDEPGSDDPRALLCHDLVIKRREARREYKCYFGAAEHYRKLHAILGSVSVGLSVVAGSSLIVQISHTDPSFSYVAALLTLLAGVLTGLLTFNNYAERARQCYDTGRKWERLRDAYHTILMRAGDRSGSPSVKSLVEEYGRLTDMRDDIRRSGSAYPHWLFKKHEYILDKAEHE